MLGAVQVFGEQVLEGKVGVLGADRCLPTGANSGESGQPFPRLALPLLLCSSRPPSAGSRRSSHDGGAAPLSLSLGGGHPPPGSQPLPVTGLAVSEEGLVSVGADGCVRLFSFVN